MLGFSIKINPTFPSTYAIMGTHFPFFTSILTIVFFLTALPQYYSQNNDTFSICSQSFSCGSLRNVSYPFWGGNRPHFCGSLGFKLSCMHNQITSIQVGSQNFNVLNINQTASTMRMVRTDFVYDHCSSNFTNTSLSASPFHFLPTVQNLSIFYQCPSWNSTVGNTFTCQNDSNKHAFYVVNGTQLQQLPGLKKNCRVSIQVQVSQDVVLDSGNGVEALKNVLDGGFDVKFDAEWSSQCRTCKESGGVCGTNEKDSSQFSCYCISGSHDSACPTHKSMYSFLCSRLFSILLNIYVIHIIFLDTTFISAISV